MAILLRTCCTPPLGLSKGLDSVYVTTLEFGRLELLAPLAQLDRASVYGTEGCRFESYEARY